MPSSVTSARERMTRSPGRRMPNSASVATRSWSTVGSTVPVARTCSAMRRASARSRRSCDTASLRSATRSMPSRKRLTSRRISAARMSTTAACWIGSSRPTAPKSMSPSVPSSNAKMLPGCGSAWKKPIRSTWSSVERSSCSASALRSMSEAFSRSVSATVKPSKRSCTSSRRVRERGIDLRDPDGDPGPSSSVISAIASASRRKSSSARRLVAN